MKTFKRLLLVSLLLSIIAILALGLTAGVMVSLGPPDQIRETKTLHQEIQTPSLVVDEDADGPLLPQRVLQVRLDLKEGEFEILAGKPGEGIRIEADYDSGIYSLEQRHQTIQRQNKSERPQPTIEKVAIRFYSKYSLMRRLVTLGGDIDVDNNIKIYLPPDVAIDLGGAIRMGESHLDLSGIPLTGLNLNLTMGDHEVRFEQPNPIEMEELQLSASKGEFTLAGLGNASFEKAMIRGSMGEVSVDLRGQYTRDAAVRTRFRMGELRITVPENIHVNVAPTAVMLGEQNSTINKGENIPEDAPSLNLQTSMSMGELNIRSK